MLWTSFFVFSALITIPLFLDEALAIPIPGRQCMLTFCPANFAEFPPRYARVSTTVEYKTNAQRLKNGIFLKPPMRRNSKPGAPAKPPAASPSPGIPHTSPPPTNIKHCGAIALKNVTQYIGYIDKKTYNDTGLMYISDNFTESLRICFTGHHGSSLASNTSITLQNWAIAEDFPLLGLIQGANNLNNASDLGPGSFNYLTLGGVAKAKSATVPVYRNNSVSFKTGQILTDEITVWSVDINTDLITAQWTNPNGSLPESHIFSAEGALYLGGDPDAFGAYFNQTVTNLTLHFLPEVRK